jgi:hypothetical protein
VWSFAIDFIPAVRTRHYASKEAKIEMGIGMEEEARERGFDGGVGQEQQAYMNGDANLPKPEASRNF